MPNPIYKKCCVCQRLVFSNHSKYCTICSFVSVRMQIRHFSAQIQEAVWDYVRKYGYVCYYTGMTLDMTDTKSPWYCVFDHWIPHDDRKIVLTSSLINDMKTDMTEDEFWYMVTQLANYKRYGTKIRKIHLSCWGRDYVKGSDDKPSFKVSRLRNKTCEICGRRILHVDWKTKRCPICAKYIARMIERHIPKETIKDTCHYIHENGYHCFYTEIKLELINYKSPWYCVLDHWMPHDQSRVVLTSALLNDMKSDLTEKEFWYFILAMADYKQKGKKIRKIKLAVFNRYPCNTSSL